MSEQQSNNTVEVPAAGVEDLLAGTGYSFGHPFSGPQETVETEAVAGEEPGTQETTPQHGYVLPSDLEGNAGVQSFAAAMAAHGDVPQSFVDVALDWRAEQLANMAQADERIQSAAEAELKQAWGSSYDANNRLAADALATLDAHSPGFINLLDTRFPGTGTRLGDDPKTIQAFAVVGRALQFYEANHARGPQRGNLGRAPTALPRAAVPSTMSAIDSEIAGIEALIGTKSYQRNETMQARLRQLYDQKYPD